MSRDQTSSETRRLAGMSESLGEYGSAVDAISEDWRAKENVRRLWDGDPTLWSDSDEASWLGWLRVLDSWRQNDGVLAEMADRARPSDVRHVVVMGMGGSSLCPDVLSRTFGPAEGFPELLVLDSTDPAQVASIEARIDLAATLFIVPSKSGGTIEPNVFMAYFWERVESAVGRGQAGPRFIAITDPDTKLDAHAREMAFSLTAAPWRCPRWL
jgi:transaldolase/glucose-6-phosphate isomerase